MFKEPLRRVRRSPWHGRKTAPLRLEDLGRGIFVVAGVLGHGLQELQGFLHVHLGELPGHGTQANLLLKETGAIELSDLIRNALVDLDHRRRHG